MDMEGLAGTFNWEQEGGPDRKLVRQAMENQLTWVVEGIRESGANEEVTEITVADSHGQGDTVTYALTELDERLHLISGCPRPSYMMPALSDQYSQVFLLGYHGAAGSQQASMDHTYSSRSIATIKLNGVTMSEAQLNAVYAGTFDIPVTFVTGDEALRLQLAEDEYLKGATFVVTKEAIARFSCKSRPLGIVRQETKTAVAKVLSMKKEKFKPYEVKGPYELVVDLTASSKADVVNLMPSAERIGPRTIRIVQDDYHKIFDAIMAIAILAGRGRL